MRADLPPEVVEALERKHLADLEMMRKLGRPEFDEAEHDCEILEDISIILWVVVIVVIASLTGMYGTAVRDAFWRLVL